jgi:hypothetical protein
MESTVLYVRFFVQSVIIRTEVHAVSRKGKYYTAMITLRRVDFSRLNFSCLALPSFY